MNPKPLSNTASARWKRRNKARVKRKLAEWLKHNRSRRLRYLIEYNASRKPQQKAYDAERYLRPENVARREATKEQKRAYMEKWSRENPENFRVAHGKRQALKRANQIGDMKVLSAWMKRMRRSKIVSCYWCRLRFPGKQSHFDHIQALAVGGAHSVDNICVSCPTCNRRKHDKAITIWNKQIAEPVLL